MTHQLIHHLYENQRPKNKPKIKKTNQRQAKVNKSEISTFFSFHVRVFAGIIRFSIVS